jgi:F-type H+-transporting ATPase subunit b
MYTIWLLVQQVVDAGPEAPADAPSVFNLNLGTSFWTLVIFFTLLFVLTKWAFPPILGYAQAREERIQKALDDARKARDEARLALEEQRRELAKAREESQRIIAQGKQDAETLRQELLDRTEEEQREVIQRAKREIEREREQAVETVRRHAVEMALAAATRLLHRRVDEEEDRRLVEEFLDRTEPVTTRPGAGAA